MTGKDNMCVKGRADRPESEGPVAKVKRALARVLFPDTWRLPPPGTTVQLAARHIAFRPDLSAKDAKPVDFSHLAGASREEIEAGIRWVAENAGWFHSVDLGQGLATPGSRGWRERADIFRTAERVKGKTVLDLGAMEGGDAFFAEEAGATVTACDVDNYLEYDVGRNAAWDYVVEQYLEAKAEGPEAEWVFLNVKRIGFEFCRQVRRSAVKRLHASVYELDPERHGSFDIVYCFGLLYHLRHPLLALERVRAVTREMTFLNNHTFGGPTPHRNSILFFNETWRGSYTNWFVPTPEAFIDMVGNVGYRKIEIAGASHGQVHLIAYV